MQLLRAVQGSEAQKTMSVSATGAAPEMGLNLPAAVAGACLGQGGFSSWAGGSSACAGYLLAEKCPNFICSCQVKTERMINGDQIKGGKTLPKIVTISGDI